ncbi:MAG: cation:proton antiporter, partial [Cyanobacteria bacterium]|nr:cation:proton antiporter [Cyanobacteriota bacterium]
MIGIEIFIELFTALIIVNLLAERFKAPSPILLLLCGVGLGFWEDFSTLSINPELIFTFILPPLIYLTAFYTSWNEMIYNKRIMFFLAIGLVVATALGVGWITQSMIPGFTLPLGVLLGAIIAPPDAIAASSIIRKLNVPRRVLTVLEGEALLNDATALVIYRFALTTLFTDYFSLNEILSHFILICVGSILYGLIAGYILSIIRHRENRMNIEVSLSLLTPFLLYLPVEAFHGSGIISTVVGGIYLGYKSPKM